MLPSTRFHMKWNIWDNFSRCGMSKCSPLWIQFCVNSIQWYLVRCIANDNQEWRKCNFEALVIGVRFSEFLWMSRLEMTKVCEAGCTATKHSFIMTDGNKSEDVAERGEHHKLCLFSLMTWRNGKLPLWLQNRLVFIIPGISKTAQKSWNVAQNDLLWDK